MSLLSKFCTKLHAWFVYVCKKGMCMRPHSDCFSMERAERSLQAPLQKCRKAAPPKKYREASTTKKCRLKICSKCSPAQNRYEAALQKVPCYV